MNERIRELNMALTQLYKRGDDLYHRHSVHCGWSDPVGWVLYSLYENEEKTYTQNDLVAMWCYPKQTVNYAVSDLLKKEWIVLEQQIGAGNKKSIRLTDEGRKICEEKILPLMLAEEQSLNRMTENERELLLQLTQKQIDYLDEEIRKITGEKSK